jgi:hypothetical protein
MRAVLLALTLATPAAAQCVFDRADGLFGSAINPAQSCTTNPHTLSFIESPPHAVFRWQNPRPDGTGHMSQQDTYDLRDHSDSTLTMLREGDPPLPETGHRPVWILRFTSNPDGYCWGRSDWSPVRCVDPNLRCDATPPSS